ncbi:hypothetical protein Back2_10430 [Nocardioides baekrokdamisoli]|uniref:Uncharacterized protein n=1 Tax=Nocardioides baekrokdamisoli TaxID=1804624 RepID=A0A3G9IEI2_9ACTN|nr:hypothetical protein [Nocardioides baekrokdamisoli]BBH16756.1 hypothetical protein Back2_10430 [Nocardioides baekrokdamisoli]
MSLRRGLIIVLGAAAFGFLGGLVHGNNGGVRGTIGNISTPWLLVALLPAWWTRSVWRGAAVGTCATVLALVTFYVGLTITMLGHLGNENGQPFMHLVWFVTKANKVWFEAGLVSGPLFGAFGGLLGKTRRRGILVAVVALLLVLEPVLFLYGSAVLGSVGQGPPDETRPYIGEALIGVVVAARALAGGYRRRPA